MAEQFDNNTFTGDSASAGVILLNTYNGTSALGTLGLTSVTIDGDINAVGDPATVTLNPLPNPITGVSPLPVQVAGTYAGSISTPNGTPGYVFNIVLNGSPTAVAVSSAPLPALGLLTPISPTVPDDPLLPCYCTGTLILTDRGNVPVEALREGDRVVTSSGAERPIRWIGNRTIECGRYGKAETIMPVRIAADAFGEGRPARDLYVSPGHSIAVDILGEVLIPAYALINGATITQESVETVTYWHVELDSHDVILAEGLPAESYLDMANRDFFAENIVVSLDPRPDADPALVSHADFCRPFHCTGAVVETVRARLAERAQAQGWRLETPTLAEDLHLVVDGRTVRGEVQGLTACFALPVGVQEVRLVSGASAPSAIGDGIDTRRLGLRLRGLTVNDGLQAHSVAMDDARLCDGFHYAEANAGASWRWTDGSAVLPSSLWSACEGMVLLRLDFDTAPRSRWVAAQNLDTPALKAPIAKAA